MDNNLESNKDQGKKGTLGKIGSFLKRRWKLVLVAFVIFYVIGLTGSPEFQDGVEKGREVAEKKEENKVEEVKEPEPEVAQDPESKPEEIKKEPEKVRTEEKKAEAPAPVVEKKEETPAPAPTTENKQTASQKGAIQTAENYLRIKGFSRSGLIEQLKYEQFSEADATYAVDNIKIDYNEQAKKSAESYMSIKGFSRGGLIDQLKYEGFSQAQAEYGATAVGL